MSKTRTGIGAQKTSNPPAAVWAIESAIEPSMRILFERSTSGGAEETLVFQSEESVNPEEWSSDGQSILYSTDPQARSADLKLLRLSDRHTLRRAAVLSSGVDRRRRTPGHHDYRDAELAAPGDAVRRRQSIVRCIPRR